LTQTRRERISKDRTPTQQAIGTGNVKIEDESVMLDILAITGMQAKLKNIDIRGDA